MPRVVRSIHEVMQYDLLASVGFLVNLFFCDSIYEKTFEETPHLAIARRDLPRLLAFEIRVPLQGIVPSTLSMHPVAPV